MGVVYFVIQPFAAMAELVDALDSGSSRGNLVDVRVILAAFNKFSVQRAEYLLNFHELFFLPVAV